MSKASALEPSLMSAPLTQAVTPVDGLQRDEISASGFPPIMASFSLHITRVRSSPEAHLPPGPWHDYAESLHGGYRALFLRGGEGIEAGISFDGWPHQRVTTLAPLLKEGLDRCFELSDG